jgi:hypothetical protein
MINGTERRNRSQQTKQDVDAAVHAQRFYNADAAGSQQAENRKPYHGINMGTAFSCLILMARFRLGAHYPDATFTPLRAAVKLYSRETTQDHPA